MAFNLSLYFKNSTRYDEYVAHYSIDHLSKYLIQSNSQRALEIGCGTGLFTVIIAELYDRIIGIDISPSQIKIANEKLLLTKKVNFEFIVTDFFKLNYDLLPKFDLILLCFCVDNLCGHYQLGDTFDFDKYKILLKTLDNLLAKNGRVVIIDVMPDLTNKHYKNAEYSKLRNLQFEVLHKYEYNFNYDTISIKFNSYEEMIKKTELIYPTNRIKYLFDDSYEMELKIYVAEKEKSR